MLLSSSYTSCSNLVFIPLFPVGKIRISLLEIQQQRKVGKDTSVPSVAWVSMDQDSWFLYDSSDYFRINSWFFECLVEVFKVNDCKSTADT
jgi:hypothetical protein